MEVYAEELTDTYVLEYYQVLTSPETKWFENNHLGLGTVKLGYLLNGTDFHRKVAMIRQTGMKIKAEIVLMDSFPLLAFYLSKRCNK